MSNQTGSYEPITSQNAALVLVHHQVGPMTGVRDYSTGELKHNVVALARAAKALELPIIVTTTARDSMWDPMFPELVEALSSIEIIDRSSVNAFDDARVASVIEAAGRDAMEPGYYVTLVKDATAAFSKDRMHAAHELNGQNFAHEILTTGELIALLPAV